MSPSADLTVDPSNEDARHGWDGDDGAYWAEHEDYFDRSLARYRDAYFAAAAISSNDRVLDVGCGTGSTTREAARRAVGGTALGVDLSSRMLERARDRARVEELTNVGFVQADAQIHPFDPASFDLVISRTGTMFFGDPVAAFSNLHTALRPGGRMTLLTWQPMAENEWFVAFRTALADGRELPSPPADAPGPFSLSDPARVRRILDASGFVDVALDAVAHPMEHGRTVDEALANVRGMGYAQGLLQSLDAAGRARALDALRASHEAHDTGAGVCYGSATWIISASRP
ncbi:MAG TPA: methyltransferase domain-containing protein [Acidimicrobiia bacterium]|nr:methyltransferase domain-containing protein [Acidimicrobiia bacterium]